MAVKTKTIDDGSVYFSKWLMACAAFLVFQARGAEEKIWDAGIGEGLKKGTHELELAVGPGIGLGSLAGNVDHELVLGSVSYAWTISELVGGSRWYRGNWSMVCELFGGGQYDPKNAFVVGSIPLIRYSLATGSRWLPFAEGGVGAAYTDIGAPDLTGRFQFSPQIGAGTHYFWNKHQALTMHFRYAHFSNGGIEKPNSGVNCGLILIGTSWLF